MPSILSLPSLQALMNTVIDSSKMYRSNFASSRQASQLVLPSSIKLLPLLVVALLKSVMLYMQLLFCKVIIFHSPQANHQIEFSPVVWFPALACCYLAWLLVSSHPLYYFLYVCVLQFAFSLSQKISYDRRTQAMNLIKCTPLDYLLCILYPRLYAVHMLTEKVEL